MTRSNVSLDLNPHSQHPNIYPKQTNVRSQQATKATWPRLEELRVLPPASRGNSQLVNGRVSPRATGFFSFVWPSTSEKPFYRKLEQRNQTMFWRTEISRCLASSSKAPVFLVLSTHCLPSMKESTLYSTVEPRCQIEGITILDPRGLHLAIPQ